MASSSQFVILLGCEFLEGIHHGSGTLHLGHRDIDGQERPVKLNAGTEFVPPFLRHKVMPAAPCLRPSEDTCT